MYLSYSLRKIILFWSITGLSACLSAVSFVSFWFLVALIPTFLFGYISLIVTWTHVRFSQAGGNYQNKIHEHLLSFIKDTTEILDIGCGSGSLIIKAAKYHADARCVGVDYWGSNWEYSLRQCQSNAQWEGVHNVEFQQGNAAGLELGTGSFGTVLSCLTFHEVLQEPDKSKVVQEALRVVKPSGRFVFMDLFDDPDKFPSQTNLMAAITQAHCRIDANQLLGDALRLPYPLNTKKVLKYARVLVGTKLPES